MAAAKPKNKGLGRGLDALFADQAPVYNPVKEETAAPVQADGNAVVYININDIKPNEVTLTTSSASTLPVIRFWSANFLLNL